MKKKSQIDTENELMVARGERAGRTGEKVKENKSTNFQL